MSPLNPFEADLPFFLQGWAPIQFALCVGVLFAFRSYMKGGKCFSTKMMKNKVALITGGSGDIAKEVAIDLLRRGCEIILACKDEGKGNKVKDELVEMYKKGKISMMKLDFSKLDNVTEFAKQFKNEHKQLDVLINCAGVMFVPFSKTDDGYEQHLQINYLGHFLLSHLLLDLLKQSPDARIINVSAVAHFAGTIHFDDINLENSEYEGRLAYSQSKLALVLFTKQLSKILQESNDDNNVSVFAIHPGICDTGLFRHTPIGTSTFFRIMSLPFLWMLMKTANDGAQTILHCAVTDELKGVSGKYYSDCKEVPMSDLSQDDDLCQRFYDLSMKMCSIGKHE